MKVKEIMTADVGCCMENELIEIAAAVMRSRNVGFIPVLSRTKARRVVGVVTDRDIALAIVTYAGDVRNVRIADCMNDDPVCCRESDSIESALRKMQERRFRRLPV